MKFLAGAGLWLVIALGGPLVLVRIGPICRPPIGWSLWAGWVLLLGLVFHRLIWRPWRRPVSLEYLAAQLERRYPRFHSTLLTATQLHTRETQAISLAVRTAVERSAAGLWAIQDVDWPINPWPIRLAAGALALLLLWAGWQGWSSITQGSRLSPTVAQVSRLSSGQVPTTQPPSPENSSTPSSASQPDSQGNPQEAANTASQPGQQSAGGSGQSGQSGDTGGTGGTGGSNSQPASDSGPPGNSFAQCYAKEIQALDEALHSPPPPGEGRVGVNVSASTLPRPLPGREGGLDSSPSQGEGRVGVTPQPNTNPPASPSPSPTEPPPVAPPPPADHPQDSKHPDSSHAGNQVRGGGSTSGQRQNIEPEPAPLTTPGSAQVHGEALGRLPQNVQALETQLAAGRVDEKLLRQLNWTAADAQGFVRAYRASNKTDSLVSPGPRSTGPLKTERDSSAPATDNQVLRDDGGRSPVGTRLTAERRTTTQPATIQERAAEEVNSAYRTQLEAFYRSLSQETK